MLSLLDAAALYIDRFKGIRISTRPDCIDDEVLALLKSYRVTSVELGAQSMDDTVLLANDRGHTADDVRKASRLIKACGMELGLQMMTGLYKSSDTLDRYTAEQFIALRPDTVRVYPTIVMRGTRLGELYGQGVYRPQTLDEAVDLVSDLIERFESEDIRVIRVGLHDSESLKNNRLAGPYHPAFRELCESCIMLRKAIRLLTDRPQGAYTLRVNPKSRSKMTGCKKSNLIALRGLGYEVTIQEDGALSQREILIQP
jgi:histone acetyltransferase (RNA polymerase elongator complex component)